MTDEHNVVPEMVESNAPPSNSNDNSLGILSLITGILGLVFVCCCYPVGAVLGIVSVVCGFLGRNRGQKFAVAGIVLGFISFAFAVILFIMTYMFAVSDTEFMEELLEMLESMDLE